MTCTIRLSRIALALAVVGLANGIAHGTAEAQITPPNISIVVIIDNSGSMKDSDPSGLRFVALRQLVDLLESGDEVAVIIFSDASQVKVQLQQITDQDSKERVKSAVRGIVPGGNTNMLSALKDAFAQLNNADNQVKFALFLTDGELSPPGWDGFSLERKESERQAVLGTATQFADLGWRLFPVSLGSAIDRTFLKRVGDNGDAIYEEATEADQLPAVFQRIFAFQRLDIFEILFAGTLEPNEEKDIPFPIHKFVRSMSVFFTYTSGLRPSVKLVRPDGEKLNASRIESEYDVYFIDAPSRGIWSVNLVGSPDGPSSVVVSSTPRASVDVQLTKPQPTETVPQGDSLDLEVKLEGTDPNSGITETITDARVAIEVEPPDGSKTTKELESAGDGVYRGTSDPIQQGGRYVFRLTAEVEEGIIARRVFDIQVALAPTPVATQTPMVETPQPTPTPAVVDGGDGEEDDGGGLPPWLWAIFAALVAALGLAIYSVFVVSRFPKHAVLVLGGEPFQLSEYGGWGLFRAQRITLGGPGSAFPLDLAAPACELRAAGEADGATVEPLGAGEVRVDDEPLARRQPLRYGSTISGQGWDAQYDDADPEVADDEEPEMTDDEEF